MKMFNQLGLRNEELLKLLGNNKLIVSISGLDNVGKSTQAKLLNEQYPDLCSKPLHINQTASFPKMKGKDLNDWWFNPNNANNFTNTMYKALKERYDMAKQSSQNIVIFDKGMDFYDTRIKATLLTMGIKEDEITNMISKAKMKNGLVNSLEDLKLVIVADGKVDHIKEKSSDISDTYAFYMGKNIELLNKELERNKSFKKIKYIPNNISLMNESIVESLSNKIKECSQFESYNNIKDTATDAFGENLQLLVLGGSAAKGKFIEGWSDLDLYVVLKNYNTSQSNKFLHNLNTNTHIGTTFYSEKDVKYDMIDNRSRMMFYELQNGEDCILYHNENFELPNYSLCDILKHDVNEKVSAFNNLKRNIYYADRDDIGNRTFSDSSNNSSKILKTSVLLEKLILRDSPQNIIGKNYADTSMEFYKLADEYFDKNNIKDNEKLDILGSTDLVECINDIKGKGKEIFEYGSAVLDTANEMIL